MTLEELYSALEEADKRAQAGDEEAKQDAIELAAMIQQFKESSAPAQQADEVSPIVVGTATGIAAGAKGATEMIPTAENIARANKIINPPAAPAAPSAPAATTPHGFHPGATSNAQFNAEQIEANKLLKPGNVPPGYKVEGNSRIIVPTTVDTQPKGTSPVIASKQEARQIALDKLKRGTTASGQFAGKVPGINVLGGGMAGYQGADAYNRAQRGDVPGAVVSGAGSAGSAASTLLGKKHPIARIGGLGVGLLAPAINRAIDAQSAPEEKAMGGPVGYASGKAVKGGLEAAKKLFTPKPTKVVRASEALGPHEGKYLNLTQSDRMRSTGGDLGGPGFSKFQLELPEYAEAQAAWGVGNKPTASGIINVNKRYPEGKAIWSPMIGSEGQHRSNQHVYDALTDEFSRQASMGKLPPELREAMNKRLSATPKYSALGLQEIDVANPEHIKNFGNTFDRRAAISEVIGGEGVGGRKGQIFDYPGVMQEMTDPMTIGSPTHAMGTRLFTLNNEMDYRPDLHSAFPYILKGEDMGVAFNPVPKELAFPSWINMAKEFTCRETVYMEMTRGIKGRGKPHQFIDDKYLRALEEAGHKEGGQINGYAAGKKVIDATRKLILPPAENAARTQIIGTLPTYEKAGNILRQQGATGRGIDFGAGLGEGAKALGKDFDTYEPFAKNWTPTYSNAADVPTDAYGQLTNLNVLNVVPREVRDEIVQDIGRVMQPGGMGIITTRGKDVMNAKGLAGPEPMSVITSRDTYQKGFNKDELEDYLKYMLGDNFEIGRLNLGPAGALIKKKAEGGLACMKEGGKTPAWQRSEGKNPEGGLNAAGRTSYNRETGGNLKAPQPEGGPRKKSFCARMSGMKKKLTSSETANDPDSRINKALRKWKC
jgi:hypothetical protein